MLREQAGGHSQLLLGDLREGTAPCACGSSGAPHRHPPRQPKGSRQHGRAALRFSLGGAQKVRVASPEEGRPGGASGADTEQEGLG